MIREGLAAAVYTQTSDVEIEVNGLMTYDRRVTKFDPATTAAVNRTVYDLTPNSPHVTQEPFGEIGGQPATLFTIHSGEMTVRLTDFGGTLVGISVPDRKGELADVLLGYDSVEPYGQRETPYFGAIVGRYANRIAKGRLKIGGKRVRLPINNGENSLHGGLDGLSRVFWKGEAVRLHRGVGVELTYRSADGHEGYPGTVDFVVRYLVTPDHELRIESEATTDQETVVNLSFHPYFNLAGVGQGAEAPDILDHELQLLASKYTPVDEGLIPTGDLPSVEGTPMDFRKPQKIGKRIDEDTEQLRFGQGYDHNWVLDGRPGTIGKEPVGARPLQRAAVLRDPSSGRQMEVLTTQPGIQFYAGNFLDGSITGKKGQTYPRRSGLCLETQHFPDSPNQSNFPNTVLRPGDHYQHVTVYRFGTFE